MSRRFVTLVSWGLFWMALPLAWAGAVPDLTVAAPVEAAADRAPSVPDPLRSWVPWVLESGPDGVDRRACPLDPGDGGSRCAWPGRLELDLTAGGGRFAQTWRVFAEDWVLLPGDADVWPQDVRDGGNALPVVLRDGRPAVKLGAGEHALTGRFQWRQRPDALAVPPLTGWLALTLDGVSRPLPRLEPGGRLWLRDPGASQTDGEGDRLRLEVARRIEDDLPLRILTRLELEVSGRAREARLGPVHLPGGVPFAIQSPLPARLESDGMLRIQVRPGRWVLEVATYHSGAVTSLSRGSLPPPWPEQEVWAFAARPDLRQVELTGLPLVDPRQTRIPEEWSRLPVYRIASGETLTLVEQRRGDPDPAPDRLTLERNLWLDFDGAGYSVQDRISGELTRTWRLEAGAGLDLGQVQVAGTPVPINRLDDTGALGVEVRRGQLNLVADGRLEAAPNRVPVSGWALAFDAAQAHLHLPPGWDLLAVSGVDNLPDSWFARWTLLDLFLVLILTIGIGRLWGWGWGALALAALALTWQSPGAPRLVWLHLLAAVALLRLLPAAPTPAGAAPAGVQRLRGLVQWYFRLSLLALLVVGLPFLVSEVRNGLYPQLERAPWASLGGMTGGLTTASPDTFMDPNQPAPMLQGMADEAEVVMEPAREGRRKMQNYLSSSASPASSPLDIIDPNARVQTGPGIPDWRWHRFDLAWTGPVEQNGQARLWLLTPGWNLAISLLGSLLLVLLGLRLGGLVPKRGRLGVGVVLLLALGLGAGVNSGQTLASDLPSPELLQELRERLLAPPDCLPHCLELPWLAVHAEPARLTLELTLDAAAAVAAPVPGGAGGWSPTDIQLDGVPLDPVSRDADGRLLVPLAAGRHRLRLTGPLPARDQVDLPLPLTPRQVEVQADGWRVEGLDAAGRPGSQLQLIRLSESGVRDDRPLSQDALPPLLLVERRLRIGLDWRVETRVQRLSAPEFPILIPVPLLPGESVQTTGVQVEGGRVLAGLAPGATELSWTSSLDPVAELTLSASADPRLAEAWHLDLGPMWHLEHRGIPPVHRRGPSERWLPGWRPLPGETLTLNLTRPLGVPGPTLTFDRVDYQVAPGRRGSDAELTLRVRSSQGGTHAIRLPEGAEPIRFSADGRNLPLPAAGGDLELPLVPGTQRMQVSWRESRVLEVGFTPSVPDLRNPAVNLNLALRLPDDHWVLFATGPGIGPAVLFWSLLLVLAGLAAALGRSRLTPLRIPDWFLLGVGLSLAQVWVVLLVAGWLFALGLRQRLDQGKKAWRFNLIQLGLVLLTLAALAGLLGAVQQGLLGRPEMQIMGNGSTGTLLNWYQDRGGPTLPEVWVFSVPMWIYRALMLAWALWLAFRLLDWLRWGWAGFSSPQLWREGQRAKDARGAARKEPLTLDVE
ncbi:hypothetical protein [Thiocystis violascens]|uniref:Uncharacterized protein n=1 Tax=Thiocystis violascens (strain ATCC 17096 / DSM 198 / 6111) TaxID=765911 RepID=I3Y7M3_THIV6|nr:hypothetical protein [Thiocystis violascens]AFL72991.1 hypothetical protein Thivi_0956 [Thiocystis violascens DSM 198]